MSDRRYVLLGILLTCIITASVGAIYVVHTLTDQQDVPTDPESEGVEGGTDTPDDTHNDTRDANTSKDEHTVAPAIASVSIEEQVYPIDGSDKYDIGMQDCRIEVNVDDWRDDEQIMINIDYASTDDSWGYSHVIANASGPDTSIVHGEVNSGDVVRLYGDQSGEVYAEGVVVRHGEEHIAQLPHTQYTEYPDKISCTLEEARTDE